MAARFDAVLFDLDNTIWHFSESPPPEEAAAAFAPRLRAVVEGWGMRPALDYAALDLEILAAEEAALIEARGRDYREPDMAAVVTRVLRAKGLEVNREQAEELRLAMWPDPTVLRPRLFDGVLETFEALRAAEVRLAAVTNRSHGAGVLAGELAYHGLESAFDAVAVAADIGWRKPHPAIIEHALRSLGVEAEQSLMVGDRANRDVEGARTAGLTSVLVRHPGMPDSPIEHDLQRPHHHVTSMAEIQVLVV